MYRFDYRLKTVGVGDAVPDWVNVPHQYELPFVWGMPYWTSLPTQVVWNSQDKKIADIVMSLWASFAKTRNPTQQIQGGAVKWEPFTEANPGLMVLDRNFSMTDASTFDYKSFAFWNSYYPKVRPRDPNLLPQHSTGKFKVQSTSEARTADGRAFDRGDFEIKSSW